MSFLPDRFQIPVSYRQILIRCISGILLIIPLLCLWSRVCCCGSFLILIRSSHHFHPERQSFRSSLTCFAGRLPKMCFFHFVRCILHCIGEIQCIDKLYLRKSLGYLPDKRVSWHLFLCNRGLNEWSSQIRYFPYSLRSWSVHRLLAMLKTRYEWQIHRSNR